MKDRKTSEGPKTDDNVSVAALASQAVTVLAARRAAKTTEISRVLLQDLIDAVLDPGGDRVDDVIETIQRSGISSDQIIGAFIPEAARQLGDAWCSDNLGFAEVTIGSARLQRALHGLCATTSTDRNEPAIFVCVPANEHHTLGALVMTEQLRRAGYSVRLSMGEPLARVAEIVATGQYRAILLSVAAVEKLAGLERTVNTLRRAAPTGTPIVVGGAIGHLGSKVVDLTGADYAGNDPFEALRKCGLKTSRKDTAEAAG